MIVSGTSTGEPQWAVRYTWLVPDGCTHPQYTYAQHGAEDKAIDIAVATLDNQQPDATLKVVCAHTMDLDGVWRRVKWSL
jgi:hypothetical protein